MRGRRRRWVRLGGGRRGRSRPGFLDDLEASEVVALPDRGGDVDEALTQAAIAKRLGSVVAPWIVAPSAGRAVTRERASRAAEVAVLTLAAEAPQLR